MTPVSPSASACVQQSPSHYPNRTVSPDLSAESSVLITPNGVRTDGGPDAIDSSDPVFGVSPDTSSFLPWWESLPH